MPSAPSGSTQTLSGKNHHSKDDHPSCAVDRRGSRVCRNLVPALGTGFWTCPSQKQSLSVTYIFPMRTPAWRTLVACLRDKWPPTEFIYF